MFCIKCGKNLPDDALFCSNCGASQTVEEPRQKEEVTKEGPAEELQAAPKKSTVGNDPKEAPDAAKAPAESPASAKKAPKKKLIIGVAAVAVVIAAITVLVLMLGGGAQQNRLLSAFVDADGIAYVCYGNGKSVKLSGDIEKAYMTPDSSKIAVLEKEGDLYWTDLGMKKKVIIAHGSSKEKLYIDEVGDKFVIYSIEKEYENDANGDFYMEFFRYDYKTGRSVTICKEDTKNPLTMIIESDASASDISGNMSYIFKQNKSIYVLTPEMKEPEELAIVDSNSYIQNTSISPDGSVAMWTEVKGDKFSLIVWCNGEKETVFSDDAVALTVDTDNYETYLKMYLIETFDSSKYDTLVDYTEAVGNQWKAETSSTNGYESICISKLTNYFGTRKKAPDFKMTADSYGELVVINGTDRTIFVNDGEITSLKLSSEIFSTDVRTTNGTLLESETRASRIDGYYVTVKENYTSDDGKPLYSLYLITVDNGERNKVVTGVIDMRILGNKLIYTNKSGILYLATIDIKGAQLTDERRVGIDVDSWIASEGSTDYIYILKNYSSVDNTYTLYVYDYGKDDTLKIASEVSGNIRVSVDGKKVYYFTDVSVDNDNGISHGMLKEYYAPKGESKKITNDIIVGSEDSNLISGEIRSDSMWLRRYQSGGANDCVYDIMYFNGKKASTVVPNFTSKW